MLLLQGRFVGLANKDGSTKTECGIHVEGAEKTFDRDLWESGKVVEVTEKDAIEITKQAPGVVVVYAPWCQFCQGMEDSYADLATKLDVPAYKLRGDETRDFVKANFNTESFPTINVVKSDGSVVKYDSEKRDVDSLKAFVEATL